MYNLLKIKSFNTYSKYFSSYKKEPGYRLSSRCPWPRWPRPRRSTRRHLEQVRRRWRRTTKLMLISTCPGRTWRSTGWTPTSSGSRWTTARTSTPTSYRKQMSFRWENNSFDLPWDIAKYPSLLWSDSCIIKLISDRRQIGDMTPLASGPSHNVTFCIIYCYHHPLVIFPPIVRFISGLFWII